MALVLIRSSIEQQFVIFADSLSTLVAALKGKATNHPYIADMLETYDNLVKLQKSTLLAWISGHGIKGNKQLDELALKQLVMWK